MYSLRGIASFDGSAFEAGINRMGAVASAGANRIGQAFGNTVSNRLAGAFGIRALVAGFEELVRSGANYAAELKDLSEQHDLTTDEVQQLSELARQSSLQFDNYASALSHFGDIRKRATKGDQEARKTLHDYGLELKDVIDPTQRNITLFEKLGKALQGVALSPQQRADLKEIFGKSGDKIAGSIGNFSGVKVPGALTKEQIDAADRGVKQFESTSTWAKSFMGRMFAGVASHWETIFDPNAKFRRELAKAPSGADAVGAMLSGQTRMNGQTDEAYFAKEADHAQLMNSLYQKGLEITFERMGRLQKIKEMNREIAALEVARDEAKNGTTDAEKEEVFALSREIDERKMQLLNFQKGIQGAGVTYDLTERQKMGGFSGGQNQLLDVNNKQAQLLSQMLQKLTSIDQKQARRGKPFNIR
jgi:hypothetical protein